MAVILMVDGHYQRLRLAPGFSCLYLWGPLDNLEATMVTVGQDEASCKQMLGAFPAEVKHRLPVNMTRIAGTESFTRKDVPVVARWDWDVRHQYFISISCGDFWCEIGSPNPGEGDAGGFKNKPAVRYAVMPAPGKSSRTVRVNGWYDEQFLAAPATGPVTPTALRGTVFPHPDLGDYVMESFSTWQPVAFVALRSASTGYREKFGWHPAAGNMDNALPVADLGRILNTISFCRGTRTTCEGAETVPASSSCPASDTSWFARSVSPRQGVQPPDTVYTCVRYRGHVHGFDIPGVTRWRWREDDESLWIRCPQGCCEYEPT